MRKAFLIFSLIVLLVSQNLRAEEHADKDPLVEHGRYLSIISGCNDCHTPGFAEAGGNLPEKEWLTGSAVGWHGPWGTTYPINLRLIVPAMKEDEWIKFARAANSRPPMPAYALKIMSADDLRALYRFISKLGPSGSPAPKYVPPDQKPDTAYIEFVPKEPK